MKMHLMEHIDWPAKGSEILKACENMSDVPKKEHDKFMKMIKKTKTYKNMDEVMKDLMPMKEKMHMMKDKMKEKMKMPHKMKAGTSW